MTDGSAGAARMPPRGSDEYGRWATAQRRRQIEAQIAGLRARFAGGLTGIGSMAGDPNGEILALEKELRKLYGKYNPIVDQ